MPGSFFDSNVILYLASSNSAKAGRVEQANAGLTGPRRHDDFPAMSTAVRNTRLWWPSF